MTSNKSENILVVCRCRPLNEKEKSGKLGNCLSIDPSIGAISIKKDAGDVKNFTFDASFDDNTTQVILYANML